MLARLATQPAKFIGCDENALLIDQQSVFLYELVDPSRNILSVYAV
jgi:hypothetical protein